LRTVDEMFEAIRISLESFANKYTNIPEFRAFYSALSQGMTYSEFYEKYKTMNNLENRIETIYVNTFMNLKDLMRKFMVERREAGDSINTTQKTIGPQNALLHVGRYNSHLLEMRGLLQRLGEMTTVSMYTDSLS
jgi:hypothetical protein